MGAVTELASRVLGKVSPSAAELKRTADRLAAELQAERQRIAGAEEAIDATGKRLRELDPGADGEKFARLVEERNGHAGRLEAHRARAAAMESEQASARTALAQTEVSEKAAELAQLDAQIAAEAARLTAQTVAFASQLDAALVAHRASCERATALQRSLNFATGQHTAFVDWSRGSQWASTTPGVGALARAEVLMRSGS